MTLLVRKSTRLKDYDYSSVGSYFITICVKDRKEILSDIVGTGVLDRPKNILTNYGKVAEKYITQMNNFYEHISVDNYVIMPNHIHLLLNISKHINGQSGRPVPTNSAIAQFIGTLKRFCNKEFRENIWQERSHDHIIRGKEDYLKIYEYIDTNVLKWEYDCFNIKSRL